MLNMKNLRILSTVILSILLFSCNEISSSNSIISEILSISEELDFPKYKGKIIVLKTGFCQEVDCDNYFREYRNQIRVLSQEDAFMMGIGDYFKIDRDSYQKDKLILYKNLDGKLERIKTDFNIK